MTLRLIFSVILPLANAGCNPTAGTGDNGSQVEYTPPEASGLRAVRPYPGPSDVCQVIGENALTGKYLDDSAILIGCPFHETGAISDRVSEGGEQLDQIGDWVLISIGIR